MATDVKLPDMGEGIEDVTINRWLVQEGDTINEGDPLVEVATDKVDTEVPSPASGTVLQLNYSEGELVGLDSTIAVVGEAGEEVGETQEEAAEASPQEAPEAQAEAEAETEEEKEKASTEAVKATPVAKRVAQEEGITLDGISGSGSGGQITKEDVLTYMAQQRNGHGARKEGKALPGDLADVASLTVRRLAALHNVDLREVADNKPLSTLSKYDVLSFVASREAGESVTVNPQYKQPTARAVPPKVEEKEKVAEETPAETPETPEAPAKAQPKKATPKAEEAAPKATPSTAKAEAGPGEEFVPHTRMRQIVARNTRNSAFTAPHVTTMWDVNMATVLAHRKANKAQFAEAGVNLTITAYFVKAIVAGLQAVPAANASWTDDGLIIKHNYNIGMAVALPPDENGLGGLIVPVIRNVDDLSLQGVARQVNELAQRARDNQLDVQDLQGGTFTLTNYGTSGSRFQTPVIVQPQVGILGVGAIEKRPVVISEGHPLEANTGDHLAFLPMTTLGFSYDHRVLDGASADAFCAAVKEALENWE